MQVHLSIIMLIIMSITKSTTSIVIVVMCLVLTSMWALWQNYVFIPLVSLAIQSSIWS